MELSALMHRQHGVVSRRQLMAAGYADHDVRRMVRRRDLTVVHPGVMVNHTGPLAPRQRAWAAVLSVAPAALWGPSALLGQSAPQVHVAVESDRHPVARPGVVVHRVLGLDQLVQWNASPPRMRAEVAVVDTAAHSIDAVTAIAVLTDAVQARLTTADRLQTELDRRLRVDRRRLLTDVVTGLQEGTGSVLEHHYWTRVERAHRLPRGERQASLHGLKARHDVVHRAERVVVELDGRAHHTSARARAADMERDVAALVAGHLTLRLAWAQVFGEPCRTARTVADLLTARGWSGAMRRCSSC